MVGTIKRGARNVLRSPMRLVLVVVLLGTSLAFAAAMLTLNTGIEARLQAVKGDVGTSIQLRPAGSFGFMGGGTLAEQDLDQIAAVDGVVRVDKQLLTQYTGTDLQPAQPAPRQDANGQAQSDRGGGSRGFAGMNMPVFVSGIPSDGSQVILFGGGATEIVAGRELTATDDDQNVALLGKALADANGLNVAARLDIEGATVEIVGLFTTGQRFGDNSIVLPIATVQRLYGLEGQVTQATVQVSSIEQVPPVAEKLQGILDSSAVDIVTEDRRFAQASEALETAKGSVETGLLASIGTAALVIVFAVLLLVRERRQEIGILKALGAANSHVVGQFTVEVLTMSLAAAATAAGVLAIAGQTIASQFALTGPAGGSRGGLQRFGGGMFGGAGGDAASDLAAPLTAGLSIDTLLVVLVLGVLLAVVASVIPVWYTARIKPAEVLRQAHA